MVLYASSSSGGSGESAGAAKFAATAGGSSASSGRVYMGTLTSPLAGASPQARVNAERSFLAAGDSRTAQTIAMSPHDRWMSTQDATADFYTWTPKAQQGFAAKGLIGGLLKAGDGIMEASALWGKLVKEAAAFGAQGVKASPLDILATYVANSGVDKKGFVRQGDFEINPLTGEKRYVGPKFKTTTQTNTDLTDPDTAHALATSVWQQLLGRNPNPGELSGFGGALATAEQNAPQTTTTTTQYDDQGEAVGSSSSTTGGMTDAGRQYLAQQGIEAKPEYGATQAATTYMDALEQAIYGARG